jgi:hypothetical protein
MRTGKGAYLKRLTATQGLRSIQVGKEMHGSSPPSLFIGAWNYPKVYSGPMIATATGDTWRMDAPESWIPSQMTQEEIVDIRLHLVRGKRRVEVHTLEDPFVEQLQEIVLSSASIESDAAFQEAPVGCSFSDDHAPFGPSANLEHLSVEPARWDQDLEKVFYDTDLRASDAVTGLHQMGIPFSRIQKALSAGTMGQAPHRCLVPTRWSITACDTMIGNHLLTKVRQYPVLDQVRMYEFSSLHNRYAVLLIPRPWQYEWTEAFLHVLGSEELVFSDHETPHGKRGYSSVGGCYYSCKMAVLEALEKEQIQAGALVFREAYQGYIPLGVFNVRENVRHAFCQAPREFEDLPHALAHLSSRFTLPLSRFIEEGTLVRDLLHESQTTLHRFLSSCASLPHPGEEANLPV